MPLRITSVRGPARLGVIARLIEVDLHLDMNDPRERNVMMLAPGFRIVVCQPDRVIAFEVIDDPDVDTVGALRVSGLGRPHDRILAAGRRLGKPPAMETPRHLKIDFDVFDLDSIWKRFELARGRQSDRGRIV